MSFSVRLHRRFPVPCAVAYHADPFLTLPLAYFSGFWSLITLLFLNTVPAYEEWVVVEKDYRLPGLQTDCVRRSRHHSSRKESGNAVAIN